MNEWLSLLQTFGLGTLILLFAGLCLWKVAPWVAARVIEPIVNKYVELLGALVKSTQEQKEVRTALLEDTDRGPKDRS